MEYWFNHVEISKAAIAWYGKATLDTQCLAENRLARGEVPPADDNVILQKVMVDG